MQPEILALLAWATAFLLLMILLQILTCGRRLLQERLEKLTEKLEKEEAAEEEGRFNFSWHSLLRLFSKLFVQMAPARRFEEQLTRGGIPLKGEEFVSVVILSTLGLALTMAVITGDLAVSIVFGAVGFVLPHIVLNIACHRRLQRFESQIGDSLVILANSLRAGFSFLQAMDMVSKEMPDPISVEFSRALREMNFGASTEEALMRMGARVGSGDLDLVVTAVLIQRQVGGNLSEVLNNISFTIRERNRIKGEIRTLTAQGKISGLVVGLLPLVLTLALFLINRSYIMVLFTHPLGLMLVGAGLLAQGIGFLFIKRLVNIET
ncbi:MAG: type II secretion system F family protein [Bacillota bacterium]